MHLECAVQEARARTARAKTLDGLDGRLAHLWVRGEPQIIVRPAHDQAVSLEHGLRAFTLGHGDEIRIRTGCNGIPCSRIFGTFFEDIHD